MATQWISPTWRMPENGNQSKVDNYSLDFDGSSDYVSMGDVLDQANDGSDPISITFWLKTTLSALGYLVSKQTGFTDGYGVFMLASGEIAFYMGTSSSSARIYAYTQNTFNDGSWKNVAVTYDGSQDVSGLNIYVDNSLQTLTTVTNNTPNNVSNAGDFTLAKRNGSAYAYEGSLAEVLIFNSALTTDQITALYNSGTPVNPMALTPLPIAYYPLGGASTGSSSTLTIPNDSIPSATVFDFDGSTDFITVPGVSLGTTCTFSCWVNFDSFSLTTGIVFGETAGKYAIYAPNSTTISANFGPSFGAGGHAFTVPTMSTGVWYNIVLTKTGANGELFFNGQSQGTTTNFGSNSFTLNLLGCERQTGATRYYVDGKISNAAVWDSDQSANIVNIYNNGIPQSTYTTTPKAWWKMNVDTSTWDGSDWIIGDSTANYTTALNFDGTSYGVSD